MVCVHIAAVGAYRDLVSHIGQLEREAEQIRNCGVDHGTILPRARATRCASRAFGEY
jgi:hypothetical protein